MRSLHHGLILAALLAGFSPAQGLAETTPGPVARAQALLEANRLEDASRLLRAYLAGAPDDRDARFLYARLTAWQGHPERALPIYSELLEAEPDNTYYLLAQGQAQLWSGHTEDALATLERAAAQAPKNEALAQALTQARAAQVDSVDAAPDISGHLPRRHEIETSARQEWLSGDFDDWRTLRLDYNSSRPAHVAWYGALFREQRFSTWDEAAEAGLVVPVGRRWALQPEVGFSPSPDFLPEWHADIRFQRIFSAGFVGAASVRRTRYGTGSVDRLALSLERYWGLWRAGYTVNISDVENAGTPVGHDLVMDYYYQGISFAGVRASLGREEEGLADGQVITSDVRSVAVRGRHWFRPRWAATWEMGHLRQGELYERSWLQLGVRHAF